MRNRIFPDPTQSSGQDSQTKVDPDGQMPTTDRVIFAKQKCENKHAKAQKSIAAIFYLQTTHFYADIPTNAKETTIF